MKLYVGNLSYTTTEDALREAFSNYGDVVSVQIMNDRFTGQSKGFGFVEMADDIMGERGIGGMNGKSVDGRRIRVSVAVDKPKRDGGAKKFFKSSNDKPFSKNRNDFRSKNDRNEHERSERPRTERESQAEEY